MNNHPTDLRRGALRILTIHGGLSNIEFALFEASGSLRWILEVGIEWI